MEGGRGGGRGKGKKSKAAKKKAAAAAVSAASTQVVASHKKVTIGTKKVATSQPVVSAAPEPSTGAHEQPMTKSKRKRLKKQAAAEALKAAQPVKRSPTAASASPKAKVAVLTPPVAATKPHVVSLTGSKKKKKRKLGAVTQSGDTATNATVAAEGTIMDSTKSPATKKKKTSVELGHTGASPTAGTESKSALSKSRPQIQSVHMDERVSMAAKAASPCKMVKKVKTEAAATASPGSTEGSVRESVKKLEVKPDIKQFEVVVGATKTSDVAASSKATKPGNVTQKCQVNQTDSSATKPPVQQLQMQTKDMGTILPKKEDAVTFSPLKTVAVETNLTPATATIVSAGAFDAKPPPESNVDGISAATTSKESHTSPITAAGTASAFSKSVSLSATSTSPPPVTTMKPAPSPLAMPKTTVQPLPSSGGLKRRRSTDLTSTNSVTDALQPPAKRTAGATRADGVQSKTVQSKDAGLIGAEQKAAQDVLSSTAEYTAKPAEPALSNKETMSAKPDLVIPSIPSPLVNVPSSQATTQTLDKREPAIQVTTSKATPPVATQAKPRVNVSTSTTSKTDIGASTTKISPECPAETKKVGIVMDSHTYVEKMMTGGLGTRKLESNLHRSVHSTVTLPSRPQNAWGASFGMVPPAHGVPQAPRTLSTTPLSSWFLSNGCANFVKQVHFSDDANSDDEDDVLTGQVAPRVGNVSPRSRASTSKKNAFLESLTTQSNWRTWYGNVDVHNLLDPPLAHVPENVRSHEVKPLALPEPMAVVNSSMKKTNELEMLEADIRREKQRGSAFGQQLLMMLQGKTVSGKLLEEEYKPVLHQ